MATPDPKILIAIDPGSHKTGLAAISITSRPGYLPNGSEVELLEGTTLIRAKQRDPLSIRLHDIACQLQQQIGHIMSFNMLRRLIAFVVEDPRDFPTQIRRRVSTTPSAKESQVVATSAGTHVTLGAAFGICLATAQQISSTHDIGPVETMGSQKWWPRDGRKKLSHAGAHAFLLSRWPGLKGHGEDVVFAAGMGLQWYIHNRLGVRDAGTH